MALTTASLPNNGQTAHFSISYFDSAANVARDLAQGLLAHCEDDFALMASWFPGVGFRFAFPISVQIVDSLPKTFGASWMDPPDAVASFFKPTVELDFANNDASVAFARYLLVTEVTEMFMASQGKNWHDPSTLSGSSEGTMGEALSRFLGAQFLRITGISPMIFSGFDLVWRWLNAAPPRPNFITPPGPGQIDYDMVGCGTCFLFFLSDQLNFTIPQIVAASGPSFDQVFANATGNTGQNAGWTTFSNLLDAHYPSGGISYDPPLETVFPVADLRQFDTPQEISWETNGSASFAWIFLTHPLPVDVTITLASDQPALLPVPASINTKSYKEIYLSVPAQPAAFQDTTVNLSASYANMTITKQIRVVRPENLTVPPLRIAPLPGGEMCTQQYVEGSSQQFQVTNVEAALTDQTGLTYKWAVTGAQITVDDQPVLTVPKLPAAGRKVTVRVAVTNALNIRAKGKYTFTTVAKDARMDQDIRALECLLQNLRDANLNIPPWVPVENGKVQLTGEWLKEVRNEAQRISDTAAKVVAAVEAIKIAEKASPRAEKAVAGRQRRS